jgi:biotin carboxyl carrier protein
MRNFSFTIHGHKYDVELKKFEENLASIEVNGTIYNVEVHKEIKQRITPTLVRSAVPPPSRSDMKIRKNIGQAVLPVIAPLPGNILNIFVSENDEVKKGDKILLYEAMKMENEVLAEKDGTIKSIKVSVGDTVLQGDLLAEMI